MLLWSCKMAARWGEGEENVYTCNMELFSTNALSEDALTSGNVHDSSLDSRDALQSFTDCLDPSILSIFEEPSVDAKSNLDEESEATLLTALTEILDNVDEDNLSPFDTLPDSEFLSGQKSREQSPLKRLLNLSLCSSDNPKSMSSVGKVEGLGMVWEECPWWEVQGMALQRSDGEEEDYAEASCPDRVSDSHPSSGQWGLPLTLGQEGNYVSVTLCHLVKNMHPYCMPVCLEPAEGDNEQMLPEGGILLEVVDQGEQGEPILAIPDLNFSVMLLKEETESEQRVPEEEIPENTQSKGIPRGPVLLPDPTPMTQEREEKVIMERPKEETTEKCPSRWKKKRKTIEGRHSKGRILRSTSANQGLEPLSQKPLQSGRRSSEKKKKPLQPEAEADGIPASISETPSDPKPKPLSLQQYRLLRQKRKPAPKENQEDHRTKWPTLPEPPKELPPLPCLLEPNPRDPRRTSNCQLTKTASEITPTWQPMGTSAPPIPEALLMPLGSALVSSNKISAPLAKPHLAQPALTALATSPKRPTSRNDLAPVGGLQGTSSPVCQSPPTGALQHCPPATRPSQSEKATSLQNTTDGVGSQEPGVQGIEMQQQHRAFPTAALQPAPPTTEPECPREPLPQTTTKTTEQRGQSDPTPQKAGAELPKYPLPTKPAAIASEPPPSASQPQLSASPASASQPGLPAQAQTTKPQQATANKPTPVQVPPSGKSSGTRELIQAFTTEIGIEAADLTSLLEQFEETQAKEQQRMPEVCGRAAAVGSSRVEQQLDRKSLEHTQITDLAGTAGLTPPATPPHQIWKPLAPVALLGNTKGPKRSPSKVIQIDPRPLPANMSSSKATPPRPPAQPPGQPPVSIDHDYCLPPKEPPMGEGRRWNVKRQAGITIKPIERPEVDIVQPEEKRPKSKSAFRNSEQAASPPNRKRGRASVRYRVRSPSSDSSSSDSSSRSSSESRSRSPRRKRFRSRHSESSSSGSSSCSPPRRRRYSYSSSRSGSWSRSRSPQGRPAQRRRNGNGCYSPGHRQGYRFDARDGFQHDDTKHHKEKAIEERRVVYVGRIRGGMSRSELKERFSLYGEIEECTLHFRDHGDNYGFITYYNTKDAFNAIENGGKLRQPDELPFDLCFGGRRQFCKSSYADLDSNREYDPSPTRGKFDALDFDTLLKQAQKGLRR
ncbi:hypothetical protein AAFF_G00138150 [Aldrovandia affinis]|uniref:RRM domain-containing protein n=1 Tax=Aldrovandia affinis TaxID=143900 RepID=A0AAD7X1X6_9TELE|nr:hypothetical protein AAFF_G00138150 [Aldrovandia affinis]